MDVNVNVNTVAVIVLSLFIAIAVSAIFVFTVLKSHPLSYKIIDYWNTSSSCTILVDTSDKAGSKLVLVSGKGILVFTYNGTIVENTGYSYVKMGYLYTAREPCPGWLDNATVYRLEVDR